MGSSRRENEIYLCRHGETDWTLSGQHTSFTDLSLTEKGVEQAHALKKKLRHISFKIVLSSPLKRALETARAAGYDPAMDERLREWNYGEYEGLTHEEIQKLDSGWNLFEWGAPGGESPQEIAARADDLISSLRTEKGPVLLFSHGHFLRVFTARWLELAVEDGRLFSLSVASMSVLGYEHSRPVLKLWNETDV